MFDISPMAALGFLLAAYAVVGNDALQTLGTFIHSNRNLHWTRLFAFAGAILVATFAYGYIDSYGTITDAAGQLIPGKGDPSFGRLDNVKKYPVFDVRWFHVLPAFGLLVLTRLGIPVSTSFMVLAIFATIGGLTSMIEKSLFGYALAFVLGLVLYLILSRTAEAYFHKNHERERAKVWVGLQWLTTAWLWSVWLMQDFANIFVFLPRQLGPIEAGVGLLLILLLMALTFANRGGPVQKILESKTAVTDIRSATIIDAAFALILYYFKERSNIPMSTTWVFLGLIAGREYGFSIAARGATFMSASRLALSDLSKAYIGLVLSVDMARGLPWLAAKLSDGDQAPALSALYQDNTKTLGFLVITNLLLLPVVAFLRKKSRPTAIFMAVCMGAAVAAFFLLGTE